MHPVRSQAMERLKSERDRLCVWLSEDPDYIVAQCGDILSMNEWKEVEKQRSASEKVRVLLEIIINKGAEVCRSFMDVLQQNQDHYRQLQQFFSPPSQASVTPKVFTDKYSVVSVNELKGTKAKSFSNKIEVVSDGASSGLEGPVPSASYVASGGSVVLADHLSAVTIDGDIEFSVSLKRPEALTGSGNEEQTVPQGPAARTITEHKVALIDCLRADLLILQHAQARSIISDVQYQNLMHTSPPARAVTDLLDVVVRKGPETCALFLQVLQEPDILETYPQLRNIL